MNNRARLKRRLARWWKANGCTPDAWWPVGYYRNRSHIFAGQTEIGRVESFHFVHSEPYPDLVGRERALFESLDKVYRGCTTEL